MIMRYLLSALFAVLFSVSLHAQSGGLPGVPNGGNSFPTVIVTSGQNNQPFVLKNGNSAVAFPVPSLTPTSQNTIAFDIFPNGTPGDHGGSGAAWMDICNKDIINFGGSPFNCIHVGTFVAGGHGVISTTSFSGATNGDLQFQINGTSVYTMKAADLDIQINQVYTIATLPACGASQIGELSAVSDALAPAYNGPLTGGGASVIPVFCNGSAWTAH
jgi:hypothetical protein